MLASLKGRDKRIATALNTCLNELRSIAGEAAASSTDGHQEADYINDVADAVEHAAKVWLR